MSTKPANKTEIRNIDELRKVGLSLFQDVIAGRIAPAVASSANSTFSQLIKATALELEQARLRREKPSVPFLRYSK